MSSEMMSMQFLVRAKYLTEEVYSEALQWQIQIEYHSYAQDWQDVVDSKVLDESIILTKQ